MRINRKDMVAIIDNLDENGNHIQSNIIDFILQYRFQGGPEQPIRYLEMKVNKNDIDTAYPELIDTIVEGKTRLILNAVDVGTFVITKLWLNDNTYELVATGIEVTLNTATLTQDDITSIQSTKKDPSQIVEAIFNNWKSTLNLSGNDSTYPDDFQLYRSSSLNRPSSFVPANTINFKENMPTLVAINMCALMDNAFVFFGERDGINTMYYVSYDDIEPLAYNPDSPQLNGVLNIYPKMNSVDVEYSMFDLMMFQKLIGVSSKNSEGSETIVNNQIVSIEGGYSEITNGYSKTMYGDYAGTEVVTDRIVANTTVAGIIAGNIVRRYKDPTRSITFSMSEAETDDDGTSWEGSIPVFSYANKIVDGVNNITLTKEHLCEPSNSPNKVDNFMLRLSTFIRYYPEFTSEYTFGVMKETTLSQELANKLTAVSGTHPIDSVFMTYGNHNPSTWFGGTWVEINHTTIAGVYIWRRTA